MVKIVFDLPFQTHTRFIESLTKIPHLQSMLNGRYIGFAENLRKSKKQEMQLLFNKCITNKQSNTCQNIDFLMKTYNCVTLDELFSEKMVIKNSRVNPLEENEEWKVILIEELSLVNLGFLDNGMEKKVAEEILFDICTI